MASDLDRAYDYCQRITKLNAKNFYYASHTLPSAKRRAIYAVYAYCRYCDDVADDELPKDEKRRLLEGVRNSLSNPEVSSRPQIFVALEDAIQEFEIPRRYFEDVIRGVETDLDEARFKTFDDLRQYCYLVASTVGLICIEIFGYEDRDAIEYAVDLGIAMQLTNIMRDVKEDAEMDRIYLPLDDMRAFGYSEQDLMNGRNDENFRALMDFEAARARRHFHSGAKLFPLLSRESRACARVLHQLYSRILDRMEASGYDVFERRIGLSLSEKLLLVARLWAGSIAPNLAIRRGS